MFLKKILIQESSFQRVKSKAENFRKTRIEGTIFVEAFPLEFLKEGAQLRAKYNLNFFLSLVDDHFKLKAFLSVSP